MKRILSLAAALLLALGARAQVGIMGGITSYATDISSAVATAEDITTYHVGVAFKLPLMGGLVLQPGILYNIKGTQLGVASTDNFKADMNTGFLEIPVQLQLGFNVGAFRPFVFAEPFVGYAITNETKTSVIVAATGAETTDTSNNWDNVKNRLEYGVGLGVGIEIFERLQVGVKYYWDMGKLYDDNMELNTSLASVTTDIQQKQCTGIAATAIIFF